MNGISDGDGADTGGRIGGSAIATAEDGSEAEANGECSHRREYLLEQSLPQAHFLPCMLTQQGVDFLHVFPRSSSSQPVFLVSIYLSAGQTLGKKMAQVPCALDNLREAQGMLYLTGVVSPERPVLVFCC